MGEVGPRSFSAIRSARLAKFISYREAITKLSEYTGDSPKFVASELKANDLGDHRCMNVLIQHGPESSNGLLPSLALDDLLSETIKSGKITRSIRAGQSYPAGGPDDYGWLREEFIEMLKQLNFPCPETLQNPSDTPPVVPDSASPETEALDEIAQLKAEIARLENMRQTEIAEMRQKFAEASDMPDVAGIERERDEALREVERLKALVPPQPVRLMEIAIAVQRRYWGNTWDANDRDTWTPQEDIWAWLKQTYSSLSEANRKKIESVACPVDRRK